MKERFTTVDLLASIEYLNRRLTGMRVANIYDVDHKTYLLKLARSEEKIVLLVESGSRLHTTEFEWPKHLQPSGFAMKLRKHLRTKRLISINQLGVDRVIDMVFGSGEYAHHLIIELYDRGNIILTDHSYLILSLLRTRTDADADVRFAVREHFSMDTIKQEQSLPSIEQVAGILGSAKPGDQLRHTLNPHFVYGTSLLTHCLIGIGLTESTKLSPNNDSPIDPDQVLKALLEAHQIFQSFRSSPSKGYLIQKKDVAPTVGVATSDTPTTSTEVTTNIEFHPLLYRQHLSSCYKEVETFDRAVDEFFSSKSSQKQDVKVIQLQKSAVKKLENIKQDHEKRIEALRKSQDEDRYKAELIEWNTELVERACLVIRSAVASSMDWGDIELLVRDAQGRGDPVANSIQGLKLHSNLITLWLKDPYEEDDDDDSDDEDIPRKKKKKPFKGIKVDIDLGLSVYANARRYYDMKKQAAKKEQKTSESSDKALKSAERKTKQTLKEAAVISRITKARKVHWFEKFYWFISSENFVVIGGRDQQQNELLVKKYLNEHDVYVHADLHGATSVIVKNHSGGPVPPKTLNEAGVMAVCYSSAWEAKIVTSAWWVYANQVSKTAPSGEYLTTGSFMIRGKKNFLPPCHLVLGFSIMFKVDESSLANHINERRVRSADEDQLSIVSDSVSEILLEEEIIEEEEEEIEGEEQHGQPLEEGEGSKLKEEEENDDNELEFPDTAISIQASTSNEGGGVRLQVQRVDSTVSVEDSEAIPFNGDGCVTYHRHISAKERKLLKKQSSSKGHETNSTPASSKPHPKPHPPPQPQSQQYKRGQKSKQKKIKDKYGDQDEEEREMRMNLLASSGALKESKGKKGKSKGGGSGGKRSGDIGQSFNPKDKYHHKKKSLETANNVLEQHHRQQPPALLVQQEEEEEEMGQTVSDTALVPVTENDDDNTKGMESDSTHDIPDLVTSFTDTNQSSSSIAPSLYDPSSTDTVHTTSDTLIIQDSTTDQQLLSTDTTISSPPPVTNDEPLPPSTTEVVNDEVESDEEEKRAILADENILQLEETQKEMFDLDSLTGCPLPNDELLYAIPVCAPYSAMHNYKFKVKLIPGTNRRGKAAKTAVHKFVQSKDSTQLEKDLLRSIKDNDLSRYFPGKVKMTLPQQSLKTKHK